mgnify:FL=1
MSVLVHRLSMAAADRGKHLRQTEAQKPYRQKKTACFSRPMDPIVTNHEEVLPYGKAAQKTLADRKPCVF